MKNSAFIAENSDKHTVELTKLYPLSMRWPIRRNAILILSTVILGSFLLVSFNAPAEFLPTILVHDVTRNLIRLALLILGGICLVRVVYDALQAFCFNYTIESEHIAICKGIIIKHRGAFPLFKITDIYLERRLLDVIFGLCTVYISTPTTLSHDFAKIEGLRMQDARALQSFLTSLVEGLRVTTTALGVQSMPQVETLTNGQRAFAHLQTSALH